MFWKLFFNILGIVKLSRCDIYFASNIIAFSNFLFVEVYPTKMHFLDNTGNSETGLNEIHINLKANS